MQRYRFKFVSKIKHAVMRLQFFLLVCILSINWAYSQDLPKYMTDQEQLQWEAYIQQAVFSDRVVSPPPGPVRAPGEWEELQAIAITWTSYQSHLREIVRHAQTECKVIINCSDSNAVKTYLTSGGVPITNIKFNIVPFNSVWHRDYGSYSVYQNDVGNLFLIDWKYNRPRPQDDVIPLSHASMLGLPIYECNANPYLLVHTGGNLMFDGLGTAMSSKLVLTENSNLTEAQIDNIMNQFFGTTRYIKFDVLPYDGIHHIDMHMKFLDEETLLVGEYPPGISDGPQIEANLAWLQANFTSAFGTPYKIIRIPMPPNQTGTSWPSDGAYYRTYTNGVFVNKTFIYPTYYTKYDTTAERILQQSLPGYKLVGIDCDDGGSSSPIAASGAIHCITNNIFAPNPLLIVHQPLRDTDTLGPYKIVALIKHQTGIQSATIYHTNDTTLGFQTATMTLTNPATNTWTGYIPQYPAGSTIYYYIRAQATSGKIQVRPITAPKGWWKFRVLMTAQIPEHTSSSIELLDPYPNPARSITCIPVFVNSEHHIKLSLYNIDGKLIQVIYDGTVSAGKNNYFFDAFNMSPGIYIIQLEADGFIQTKRIAVFGY